MSSQEPQKHLRRSWGRSKGRANRSWLPADRIDRGGQFIDKPRGSPLTALVCAVSIKRQLSSDPRWSCQCNTLALNTFGSSSPIGTLDATTLTGPLERKCAVMTMIEFLLLLLIAAVCGSLAQALSGYSRGGCLVTIVLGFIGALLGTWMARTAGLPEVLAIDVGGQRFPIVWSVIGGAMFCAMLGLLARRRAIFD